MERQAYVHETSTDTYVHVSYIAGMLPLRVPRDGPGDASVNNAGGPPTVYREITSPMDEMADNMNILTPKQGDKPFHATQVAQHLFNVMSGRADVDHPLCEECTDSLLDQVGFQSLLCPSCRWPKLRLHCTLCFPMRSGRLPVLHRWHPVPVCVISATVFVHT